MEEESTEKQRWQNREHKRNERKGSVRNDETVGNVRSKLCVCKVAQVKVFVMTILYIMSKARCKTH